VCSLFYRIYVARAAGQILFALACAAVNVASTLEARDEPGECNIYLGRETGNMATMQCRQKRFEFFYSIMWIFILQLAGMIGFNVLILIWSLEASGWRSVTR
jgi:hypothetical protein